MKTKSAANAARNAADEATEFETDLFFLAHELQAPLRKINGFAGLLTQCPGADPKIRLYTEHIRAGTEQMTGLIAALFRYSFAIAQPNEPARVDIYGAVEEVLKNLAPHIRQAGGIVRNEAEGSVMIDPQKLASIIMEFVSNALKFRKGKRPRIRISTEMAGKEMFISVSDNGIGVAPDDTGKLFAFFRRLHSGKEFPGAGVGLALCRRLAKQCGGRVWLKSEPGKGAVFYLAVPAR